MVTHGRIVAISISTEKGTPKTNVPQAILRADWGMEGDAHAGDWHRQISLLALESIEKIRALGMPEVMPGDFAENITTVGFDLLSLSIGDHIIIGKTELQITQIGKECHTRCAIYERAGDCVMPREGIFARVIKGGTILTNDVIRKTDGTSGVIE
jgi:MOSC domain-containing protein YiiM